MGFGTWEGPGTGEGWGGKERKGQCTVEGRSGLMGSERGRDVWLVDETMK